jgi:Polyketide cyclase / dehydrase and lipid transport
VPRAFTSDRGWDFDVATDALWERLSRVDDYGAWWPWLRDFDPVGGFAPGARWRCEVAPPLPYVVRFTVHLDHIEEGRSATARVSGDVRGRASLTVDGSAGGGSRARLRSELAPANPVLRSFGMVARPVVEWGHDWVLDQGLRQFVGRALDP